MSNPPNPFILGPGAYLSTGHEPMQTLDRFLVYHKAVASTDGRPFTLTVTASLSSNLLVF